MTTAVAAQTSAAQLRPALFVQIDFETETVWMWSGLGTITPPGPPADPSSTFPYGQAFIGMGWLGQVPAIPEVTDVVSQNVTLGLSGIPAELVTDALNAVRQTSTARIWIAFLDGANNLVKDPVQASLLSLDVPTITEGADTCEISITGENPLVDLNRAPGRRFTDVDQQVNFPGDLGFAGVGSLQGLYLGWPMYLNLP